MENSGRIYNILLICFSPLHLLSHCREWVHLSSSHETKPLPGMTRVPDPSLSFPANGEFLPNLITTVLLDSMIILSFLAYR